MMLEVFTWADFFTGAGLLCLAWYVWLFLFYDKVASRGWVGAGGMASSGDLEELDSERLFDPDVSAGLDLPGGEKLSLMGKSKLPQGMERVSASSLVFADDPSSIDAIEGMDAAPIDPESTDLLSELLADLSVVFEKLSKIDGSKSDLFRLIADLKEGYPGIASYPGILSVNAFVLAHAPFNLSSAELDTFWD